MTSNSKRQNIQLSVRIENHTAYTTMPAVQDCKFPIIMTSQQTRKHKTASDNGKPCSLWSNSHNTRIATKDCKFPIMAITLVYLTKKLL